MNSDITPEAFDALLAWLDDNREEAGKKYEIIRTRLVKLLTCRGCWEAEDVVDETISRVAAKIPQIAPGYQGEKGLYFYGVAKFVFKEWLRRQKDPPPPPPPDVTVDESAYECLDGCMKTLPEENRQMVLRYYENEKKAKIDERQAIADELGIGLNALRIRAHRIRLLLRKCVTACMDQLPAN